MADGARERREAIRQLADLRRRLAAAEDTLTDTLSAMKQAEAAYDAADARFAEAERVLDAAREERAQARRDRYTARQEHERASVTADRLARRVRDLGGRLDGMRGLGGHPHRCSNCVDTVRRPAWWNYPLECENGHLWGPGWVLVGWDRCDCPGARSAGPERWEWAHTTMECRVPVEVVDAAA